MDNLPTFLERLPTRPDTADPTVTYQSRGIILVVGDGTMALSTARRLSTRHVVVLVTQKETAPQDSMGPEMKALQILIGRVRGLRGWLGNFQAELLLDGGREAVPQKSPGGHAEFDIVLDLSAEPIVRRSVEPIGYFFAREPESLARAEAMIGELVGYFAKPRFFDYTPQLCAHESFGVSGCTRCLHVCGAQAIKSAGKSIYIEPHLCQGCAACSLACPTGALSFARPGREELKQMLQNALRESGQPNPVLVALGPDAAGLLEGLGGCVTLSVNALPAFGEELWLVALALGVSRVILLDSPATPAESRALIEERLRTMRIVLGSMGCDGDLVVLAKDRLEVAELIAQTNVAWRRKNLQLFMRGGQKRELLMRGFNALQGQGEFAAVELPDDAAMGEIVVDGDRCTLCSSCAHLCPAGAIAYVNYPKAELRFLEAACVQCHICRNGCPEKAITLRSRFAPKADREAWRTISEDTLAPCIECGKAFIPRKLLRSLLHKAREDLDLPSHETQQLQRCPDCRHHVPQR